MKKIIFLYASLEPYIKGCLDHFSKLNKDFEIHFIKNDESIIETNQTNLKIFSKSKINDLLKFCKNIDPSLVIISGRMSSVYLKVARFYKGKIKVVNVSDTIFDRSPRGILRILLQKKLYHNYFDYFWGIGSLQTAHALSIGYKKEKIFENFYVSNFENSKPKFFFNSKDKIKVLSVARLVKEKNLIRVAEVIDNINKEKNFNIKYNIIGKGPLENELKKFNCVNLIGYVDQSNFPIYALNNDIFCLPSKTEPWGVVLHEFSSLGMPLMASTNCGSAFNLLIDRHNGYKFKFNNNEEIKNKLIEFIELEDKLKKQMSKKSIEISKNITKEIWSSTLKEIFFR